MWEEYYFADHFPCVMRTCGSWKEDLLVSLRSSTKFFMEPKFKKAVQDFGPSSAATVLSNIQNFEHNWHENMEDEQLRARYDFKAYRGVHRLYGLFQIRLGPSRRSAIYRAAVMFYDEQSIARWVHAFKKERMSERQEVELAFARADECWNKIRGER